jgi:hypothetical protein
VQAGTPCTIAAGNDGQSGIFDTSGAGDAMGATGVGSIDSITSPIFAVATSYAVNGVEEADFPYLSATAAGDFGTTNLPLYAITLDTTITSNACSALDPSTPGLSSYVVLVRRGSCTFSSKIANVAAFGVCFLSRSQPLKSPRKESRLTVGSPETLSTITCSRGMLVAFIVSEVVYYG